MQNINILLKIIKGLCSQIIFKKLYNDKILKYYEILHYYNLVYNKIEHIIIK